MISFLLRLVACVLFFPSLVPFVILVCLTVIAAAAAWLFLGWREDRIDAVLLNPALVWAAELPLVLFKLSERRT